MARHHRTLDNHLAERRVEHRAVRQDPGDWGQPPARAPRRVPAAPRRADRLSGHGRLPVSASHTETTEAGGLLSLSRFVTSERARFGTRCGRFPRVLALGYVCRAGLVAVAG